MRFGADVLDVEPMNWEDTMDPEILSVVDVFKRQTKTHFTVESDFVLRRKPISRLGLVIDNRVFPFFQLNFVSDRSV